MQRSLRDNEFTRRVVAGHVVCINVIRTFVVVHRLQLEPRMVIRQNVCETILRTIARQVSERAWLITSDVLQFLEFLAESVLNVNFENSVGDRETLFVYLKSESADINR